jgi:hypothetical protein
MTGNILRKIFVALIILTPVISYTGCKKQSKCGCGQDVIKTLTNASAYIYFTNGETITAIVVGDPYSSTYTLCNPSEMFKNLVDAKSGDILLLSGKVYYNCNYVYQASNSSYYQGMAIGYDIQATGLYLDLYGKGNPATVSQLNPSIPQK